MKDFIGQEVGHEMNQPRFITFTGVDANTDIGRCREIAMRWPVEWGCLIGGKLGNNRYPSLDVIIEASKHLRTALHVCRDHAAMANMGHYPETYYRHKRLQVNMATKQYDVPGLNDWAFENRMPTILQTRGEFPAYVEGSWIQYLFDKSGGRGTLAETMPAAPSDKLVGYAGGMNPDNVAGVVSTIRARNFWIDMETGVRDENDWLDLDKVVAVCKAVYGG